MFAGKPCGKSLVGPRKTSKPARPRDHEPAHMGEQFRIHSWETRATRCSGLMLCHCSCCHGMHERHYMTVGWPLRSTNGKKCLHVIRQITCTPPLISKPNFLPFFFIFISFLLLLHFSERTESQEDSLRTPQSFKSSSSSIVKSHHAILPLPPCKHHISHS